MESIGPTPANLLPEVVATVREAGGLLREEFHRPGGARGHGGHAAVDTEIELFLKSRLTAVLPCACLAEETAPSVSCDGQVWVIDPHDGTKDFLLGRRGSAISVALLRDGQPVLGVVFAPLAPDDEGDLIAWAEGADLTRNGNSVQSVEPNHTLTLALNADAGCYAQHNHEALGGMRVRAFPSPAYRLALAAADEVNVAASLVYGLAPWDLAGGHALLIGAGKRLCDLHGKPIDYGMRSFNGCVGGRGDAVQQVVAAKLGPGKAHPRPSTSTKTKVRDSGILSRAQGCLLGQLAGDALGSAVEFKSADKILEEFPAGVRHLTDGGTWDLIAGQPTDDSEMALALARALVENNNFSAEAVGDAYVAWLTSEPFDYGTTTSTGIMALAGLGSPLMESQSNGALMRVSPIGIFAAGNPDRAAGMARQDAALTHPNPACQSASAAFAAAIAVGIGGGDERQMWHAAHEFAGIGAEADAVRSRLEASVAEAPDDFQGNMGWVLTALQNAFHFLWSNVSLEDAVIATVSRGGDTDTNAAICGALLGARFGRDSVPLQWRNAVLSCRPVQGEGICHPRPMTYWPDDALDLAEALLASGEVR